MNIEHKKKAQDEDGWAAWVKNVQVVVRSGRRQREMPRSPSNRSQVPDMAIARHIGLTISYLMSLHSHCSPSLAQILYKLAIVSRATKVSPMDGLITGNYDSTGSLLQSSLYSSWRYFAFLFFRSRTDSAD